MPKTPRQTPRDLKKLAELLRAMAHPLRLRMLLGLCTEECNVNKVWQRLRISQPLASQHLSRMRRAGLLEARRNGQQVCYRVSNPRIKAILDRMCELFPPHQETDSK